MLRLSRYKKSLILSIDTILGVFGITVTLMLFPTLTCILYRRCNVEPLSARVDRNRLLGHVFSGPCDGPAYISLIFAINITLQYPAGEWEDRKLTHFRVEELIDTSFKVNAAGGRGYPLVNEQKTRNRFSPNQDNHCTPCAPSGAFCLNGRNALMGDARLEFLRNSRRLKCVSALVGALSAKIEINHCPFKNTFQNV